MVSEERLVTRPEVDYPAVAPLPGAQAAEHLTATEPADHQQLVRLRDIEPFTVHLLTLKFDVLRHPFKDRVTWAQVPETLPSSATRHLREQFVPSRRLNGLLKCPECSTIRPMPPSTACCTRSATSSATSSCA